MAYRFDDYDNSLVIDGWQNGIADSPYDGISDLRNVEVTGIPGEASVSFATASVTMPSVSGSMTNSSDSNNTITLNTAVADGTVLVFAGAGLPGGITAGTKYAVKLVSGSTYSAFVSYATYVSGSAVNITADSGVGTFTSTNMDLPTQRFYDKVSNKYFVLDKSGRAWFFNGTYFQYLLGTDATTTTNASGAGIIAYHGYLFVFRNALIDYMVITTGVWTYAWQTMNTGASSTNSHYAYLAITDDSVYYCDSAYIGSFFQKPGTTFNPGDSATFTWNVQALTLPSYDVAQCLSELGNNLLIGGQLNSIYPWNRLAVGYSLPILLAENFVQRMVTVNTNTYILAGTRGRIYVTNGSQAQVFKKVPDHISGTALPSYQWGDLASNRNQLYFGIKAFTSDGNLTAIPQYGGVWALDLDSEAIRLAQKLSYATYAGIATVILPAVSTSGALNPQSPTVASGAGLFIGWDSGASTYGMDQSSGVPYTSSEATIDSDLIPIGTYDKPRNANRVEYRLTRPLVSGESVTVQYRLIFNTTSTGYTTVLTDSTAGNYSLSGPINFANAQWLQFKIILNSTASVPSYVRLKEMRIMGLVPK